MGNIIENIHRYAVFFFFHDSEHHYDEVEADGYDLEKPDAHFNSPAEKFSHSNEFESPYDTGKEILTSKTINYNRKLQKQ